MRVQGQETVRSRRAAGPVAAMLETIRRRRARWRNLAEFGALDGLRLEDIGVSEHRRAQIICAS